MTAASGADRSGHQLLWINGPFGAGKTTAARRLQNSHDRVVVFDPEVIGSALRTALQPVVPVRDFQEWPAWREAVAAALNALARELPATPHLIVVPQTIVVQEYWAQIRAALDPGLGVHAAVLRVSKDRHRARVVADPEEPMAVDWRLTNYDGFDGADWIRSVFHTVDVTDRNPDAVAEVLAAVVREGNDTPAAPGPATTWREVEYDSAWAPFQQRFAFAPEFYERDHPAIRLPDGALVLDLSPVFAPGPRFASGSAAVDAAAFRAFVWLAGDADLVALDWQHPAYRYSPAAHVLQSAEPQVRVFPDGDYYAHMAADLRWGTFGHPWQQTLTIWGDELVASLGAELLTWLPRHPQSPSPLTPDAPAPPAYWPRA